MNRMDEDYWTGIVNQVAEASTCRVKIGCVLVQNRKIVGTGFVGSVPKDSHCADSNCLFVESNVFGSGNSGKTCIKTVHAELNAVIQCFVRGNEKEGYLECYCTYQPCLNCLKALLSVGARKIVYQKIYKDEWRDIYVKNLSDFIFNRLVMYQHIVLGNKS